MRFWLSLILLATTATLLFCASASLAGIAASTAVMLPGLAIGLRVFGSLPDRSSRLALACGAAFLWSILFTFAIDAIPGPVSPFQLLVLLAIISLYCIVRLPEKSEREEREDYLFVLFALVLLSATLRFWHLGTAEFQGDETRALLLGSGVAAGDDGILLVHRKGPAEALLATPPLLLLGSITETSARFPFALAGTLIVLAVFVLARRLWPDDSLAAIAAAAIVSIDGFLFAFSRIVQYQTVLVLLLCCAFICASFLSAPKRSIRFASLGASAFAAGALLCHYDTLFALPALAFYCLRLLERRGLSILESLHELLPAALQFIVLCAAFYAPFFLHESFGNTAGYLSQRLGLERLPANNLPRYFALLSFYGGTLNVFLVYAALAYFAVLSLRRPAAERTTLLLWSGLGLIILGVFFARPNTHFYVIHASNALLAGAGISSLMSSRFHVVRWIVAAAFLASTVLSILYLRHIFLRPGIEYRFAFPRARPAFMPDFLGASLPAGAFFGFQRRSGWKVIGALYNMGVLSGSYGSNEEELITSWYIPNVRRNQTAPLWFFIATRPNDPVKVFPSRIEKDYHFWGRVYVADRRSLDIYSKEPPQQAPQRFDLEHYIARFDKRDAVFADARAMLSASPSR